jgi:hypothetical protein
LEKSFSRVTKGRNKDECHAWDTSPGLGLIDANAVAVLNAHHMQAKVLPVKGKLKNHLKWGVISTENHAIHETIDVSSMVN